MLFGAAHNKQQSLHTCLQMKKSSLKEPETGPYPGGVNQTKQ